MSRRSWISYDNVFESALKPAMSDIDIYMFRIYFFGRKPTFKDPALDHGTQLSKRIELDHIIVITNDKDLFRPTQCTLHILGFYS